MTNAATTVHNDRGCNRFTKLGEVAKRVAPKPSSWSHDHNHKLPAGFYGVALRCIDEGKYVVACLGQFANINNIAIGLLHK